MTMRTRRPKTGVCVCEGPPDPREMFGVALRMTGRHCNLRAERPVICNNFSPNRDDGGKSALLAERISYELAA